MRKPETGERRLIGGQESRPIFHKDSTFVDRMLVNDGCQVHWVNKITLLCVCLRAFPEMIR